MPNGIGYPGYLAAIMPRDPTGEALDRTLSAAARWSLLALLFERPRPGWCAEIEAIVGALSDPELRRGAAMARAAGERAYLLLFTGDGGLSPRETRYRKRGDRGQLFDDLQDFYRAFDYEPRAGHVPDHIAVEAGFVGHLQLREAYAATTADRENAQSSRLARDAFLRDHLAGWVGEFTGRMETRAQPDSPWLLAARCLERMTGPRP